MPEYTNLQQSKQIDPDNGGNSQFWRGGVFYVNRNDPRLLVEKRSGLGMTFNFAHPVAWVLLGIIIAVIVAFVLIVSHLAR
jgi:uncharacterized membrane protein